MINSQHLEQLITFAKEGTLSKAADSLSISQPSLTRNMQHLEEDLGVVLFRRSKNKLSLTETGEYAVRQATELLEHQNTFLANIKHFAMQATTLFGGISAPGIEWEIRNRLESNEKTISLALHDGEHLLQALFDESFQFIVTDYPIPHKSVISSTFFKEQLYLSVPNTHPYALRDEIHLTDLNGLTMLLWANLGIWQSIVDRLTQTKFIIQNDRTAFEELIQASSLPHFSTNITQENINYETNRVHIPISDTIATKTFYISVLKKNRDILKRLTK